MLNFLLGLLVGLLIASAYYINPWVSKGYFSFYDNEEAYTNIKIRLKNNHLYPGTKRIVLKRKRTLD